MSQPLPQSYHFKRRAPKKSRLSMREILDQPLPHLRMEFVHQLNKAKSPDPALRETFAPDRLNYFLDRASRIADVDDEIMNVDYAIAYGKTLRKPDLSTPEKQFVWAAALSWLSVNPGHFIKWPGVDPKAPQLTQTALWSQIVKAPRIREELSQHAFAVFEGIRDDSTRLRWGAPHSWFYFRPDEKLINIDLSYSLLAGLEHARAVVYHEIGHALLTLELPPKQEALHKEMLEIKRKQRGRENKLAPEDYKRLAMLDFEWKLRHQLFNCAEDNCVNTYADRMGSRLQQDYGFSLNHISATITSYGVRTAGLDARDEAAKPSKPPVAGDDKSAKDKQAPKGREWSPEAQERLKAFEHLCDAVNMAFFCGNGLFPDTPEGWAELKLDPTKIGPWSKAPASPNPPPAANGNAPPAWQTDPKSFDALVAMCTGLQKSMASLQPDAKDRLYGSPYFDSLKRRMNKERNEIVEKIWDLHAEDLIRPLLKELDEKLEEQMQEQKKQQEKQKDQQGGDEGDDQDGEGQGQDGEGQEGGESQGQDGQGKGKKGQKGKQKKSKPQKGQKGDPQEGDESGDDQDGDQGGQPGDKQQDGPQKGKSQGKGRSGEKTVDVDGVGDMPDIDVPGEAEDKKKEQDAKNKSDKGDKGEKGGQGDGEDKGESVKDLMEKSEKGQKGDQDGDDGDEGDEDGDPSSSETKSRKPGQGQGRSFDDLTKADLAEYDKVVVELAGPIAETARLLRKIREHQLRTKPKLSRDLDMLPEDGDAGRLNPDAHQSLVTKQITQQNITEKDFHRFRADKQNPVWADIELVILIDGSGSMNGDRLKRAMQAAIILYEAGKRVGIDCYIGMWGNDDPPIVARPGDDHATIGKAIATIMKGLQSGTKLVPAIHKSTKEIAYNRERRAKNPLVGLTHMQVISDGDIQDPYEAKAAIDTLFNASRFVTLDVALVAHDSGAIIGKLKDLKTRYKHQEISVTDDLAPGAITSGMVGALLQRIRMSGSFTAVPRGVKRQTFKRAYHQMRPKP